MAVKAKIDKIIFGEDNKRIVFVEMLDGDKKIMTERVELPANADSADVLSKIREVIDIYQDQVDFITTLNLKKGDVITKNGIEVAAVEGVIE